MVIEADSYKLMKRTSNRPLATGIIGKNEAAIFASTVGVIALLIFQIFTTSLATLLAAIAIAFYVIIYTVALKRRTPQNIVWGGAA